MATLKVHNGLSWDTAVGKVWDGAAWIEKMAFHDGTSFVDLYASGPSVVMADQNHSTFRVSGSPAFASIRVDSDGKWYLDSTNGQNTFGTATGTWLASGLNSEVWIERTVNSGSLSFDGIGTGRVAMTSDRLMSINTTSMKTVNFTLRFYDAASGGNLLNTANVILSTEIF